MFGDDIYEFHNDEIQVVKNQLEAEEVENQLTAQDYILKKLQNQ